MMTMLARTRTVRFCWSVLPSPKRGDIGAAAVLAKTGGLVGGAAML